MVLANKDTKKESESAREKRMGSETETRMTRGERTDASENE